MVQINQRKFAIFLIVKAISPACKARIIHFNVSARFNCFIRKVSVALVIRLGRELQGVIHGDLKPKITIRICIFQRFIEDVCAKPTCLLN